MTARSFLGVVFVVAVAIYLPSVSHFFVSDDFLNLERNSFRTIGEGLALFSANDTDFYRPIPRLHFGLLLGIFADRVVVWNGLGILIHALTSVLALVLARQLLGRHRETAARWTGILFAIHFIHVEPVVWASGVTTTWVTLFLFGALVLHRRSRRTGRARDLTASVVCFVAALHCKETALAFVPLWLLTLWAFPARGEKGRPLRVPTIAEAAPFAVVLVAYLLVVTGIDRGGDASPYRLSVGAHTLKNAAFFLLGGFVPVRYWEVQAIWAQSGGVGAFLGALLPRVDLFVPLVAGGLAVAAAAARGGREIRGALGWIIVSSGPFLFLPGSGERFLYLASFGACLLLGIGLEAVPGRLAAHRRRIGTMAAAAVVLAMFAAGNADRQRDWIDAARWTKAIVSRWTYLRERPEEEKVQFAGIPASYRSAWLFRNGFDSMVRMYWQGRSYWREEEAAGRPEPDLLVRFDLGPSGTVVMTTEGVGLLEAGPPPAGRGP